MKLLFALIVFLTATTTGAIGAAPPVALVPQPARLTVAGPAFTLGPKTAIVVTSPTDKPVGLLLAQRLRTATGYPVPVVSSPRAAAITLTHAHADPTLGREGYTLTANSTGVTIRALGPAGLFYGTQTLRQLLPPPIESRTRVTGVPWRVPGVRVWDRPRFPHRGLMLDSARHLQSVAFIKRTIDLLAYHKLNTFHWHLSDDQGWRLEIKRYPKLTQVGAWRTEDGHQYGGFYTQAQVKDIVAYAAVRFITVVPEIDMPAHSGAALRAYPELGCQPGPNTLCPGKATTYAFVEGVLSEVMALFPSQAIHIGGDECPKDQWKTSPDCQALMKREHLANEDALQNYFTRRVASFLAAHGRRLQGWNEIRQGGPLPTSVIVQQWNDPSAAVSAVRAGNDVVASLTKYVYFDYSNETTPLQRVYSFEPMPAGLTTAEAKHILGPEACLWTETKPTDAVADQYLWPRVCALAEVAWSPAKARDWPDFKARLLSAHFARLAQRGLGDPNSPTGDTVRLGLIERSNFDWGTRIGSWDPTMMSEQWQTHDWDVTPYIHGSGTYTLRLNYESGADALAMSSVQFLKDGQPVAEDVHDGWTGGATRNRAYTLPLKTYEPKAHYSVRVRLRSDGGTDSHGALWLQGP